MIKRLTSKDFYEVYSKIPRLCVDLVVQSKDGILLTKRNIPPAKGLWHLPGGTVLYGEILQEAALRIAKKELGVKIKIKKQIGVIEYMDKKSTIFGHAIAIAILVIPLENNIKLDNQASDYKFFTKIPENTISESKTFLKHLPT